MTLFIKFSWVQDDTKMYSESEPEWGFIRHESLHRQGIYFGRKELTEAAIFGAMQPFLAPSSWLCVQVMGDWCKVLGYTGSGKWEPKTKIWNWGSLSWKALAGNQLWMSLRPTNRQSWRLNDHTVLVGDLHNSWESSAWHWYEMVCFWQTELKGRAQNDRRRGRRKLFDGKSFPIKVGNAGTTFTMIYWACSLSVAAISTLDLLKSFLNRAHTDSPHIKQKKLLKILVSAVYFVLSSH